MASCAGTLQHYCTNDRAGDFGHCGPGQDCRGAWLKKSAPSTAIGFGRIRFPYPTMRPTKTVADGCSQLAGPRQSRAASNSLSWQHYALELAKFRW